MEAALWVAQVLVALAFAFHGYQLAFALETMRGRVVWPRDVSDRLLRPIGILEILGAIGVVIPAATGVLPSLTVAAASGLVAMMLLAILFHITRREWPNIGLNVVLGALAFAVAYGRLVIEPL